jgi:hypothetical protein
MQAGGKYDTASAMVGAGASSGGTAAHSTFVVANGDATNGVASSCFLPPSATAARNWGAYAAAADAAKAAPPAHTIPLSAEAVERQRQLKAHSSSRIDELRRLRSKLSAKLHLDFEI